MNRCVLVVLGQFACVAAVLLAGAGEGVADPYVPWTALTQDLHPDQATYPGDKAKPTWIGATGGVGGVTVNAHTVGGSIIQYTLGFNEAKDGDPAGNDSMRFQYDGQQFGHHVGAMADSFTIRNEGGTKKPDEKTFNDILLLVAIDAASLGDDFSFSVRQAGAASYTRLDSSHFVYYDPTETGLGYDTGRPTGNHADFRQVAEDGYTGPLGLVSGSYGAAYSEDLAYDFPKGMVSIFALEDIDVAVGADGSKDVDYLFEGLPGKAVFSIYGYREWEGYLRRTNQSVAPGDFTTFEVAPVPEPASLPIVSFGGALCVLRRRRKG